MSPTKKSKAQQQGDPKLSGPSMISQTEQTEALFHLISGMAQEINAPLQEVTKHTQRLIKDYRDREFEYISFREFQDIMQTIESVHEQLQYSCETTQRLISLHSRRYKVSGKVAAFDDVMNDITQLMQDRLDIADVKLIVKIDKNLPDIMINPLDLSQIARNICENALQAMPVGGVLSVKAIVNDEGLVQLNFQDDGIGINKENIAHIFDPFFTTKERGLRKNSGLGLSIVYSLVKKNKGDVSVESSSRKGTLVKVMLLPVVEKVKSEKVNS